MFRYNGRNVSLVFKMGIYNCKGKLYIPGSTATKLDDFGKTLYKYVIMQDEIGK